jgi:hypothetical protein
MELTKREQIRKSLEEFNKLSLKGKTIEMWNWLTETGLKKADFWVFKDMCPDDVPTQYCYVCEATGSVSGGTILDCDNCKVQWIPDQEDYRGENECFCQFYDEGITSPFTNWECLVEEGANLDDYDEYDKSLKDLALEVLLTIDETWEE